MPALPEKKHDEFILIDCGMSQSYQHVSSLCYFAFRGPFAFCFSFCMHLSPLYNCGLLI